MIEQKRQCLICFTLLTKKQKSCCSVACQSELTRRRLLKPRKIIICLQCKKSFKTRETLKRIFCSKPCSSEYKKTSYLGKNNPMYGTKWSKEKRKQMAKLAKINSQQLNLKEKQKEGIENFIKLYGVRPDQTIEAKEKKKQTYLKKYGVEHNWSNKESRKKCEQTCLSKYGKYSWQIAAEKNKKSSTNIENIIEHILKSNNIKYKKHFRVYYNKKEYKVYDFYCMGYNVLIEADGDYWHANPIKYSKLNETQLHNKKNDNFKNKLAKQKNYKLLRFFEAEINDINFFNILLFNLGKYEKI